MLSHRPASRFFILTGLAVFFILTISFFRVSPMSPESRAPGHLTQPKQIPNDVDVTKSMLLGNSIMPTLENKTAKAELGRSSWHLFHTVMSRYPEKPTGDDQRALSAYVYLFARLYPCGDCASHFIKLLKTYPPQTSSRNAAAGWACLVHNEVNRRLKKDLFDCTKIGDFYDCGCGDKDSGKDSKGKDEKKGGKGKEAAKDAGKDGGKADDKPKEGTARRPKKMLWGDANGPFPGGPVEITDEP
ncbi:FAD-linked sulfhydryl oxidase ERV2 [Arthroderma uncinatum]|uniref:FAD-linked sulfhydryl oxidase ERV2 n=1 Tax=Arthroderma uncinatum TaxID=74035 RepID=UPI00144AADBC|nr:FAD-linked sulfhydryl oxidase ERV2 [Arthroderma uncinatum]KAF3491420.1 FAD-linked sulfhydryl oxidase ERV2 [Arthroderma uncinatum]